MKYIYDMPGVIRQVFTELVDPEFFNYSVSTVREFNLTILLHRDDALERMSHLNDYIQVEVVK